MKVSKKYWFSTFIVFTICFFPLFTIAQHNPFKNVDSLNNHLKNKASNLEKAELLSNTFFYATFNKKREDLINAYKNIDVNLVKLSDTARLKYQFVSYLLDHYKVDSITSEQIDYIDSIIFELSKLDEIELLMRFNVESGFFFSNLNRFSLSRKYLNKTIHFGKTNKESTTLLIANNLLGTLCYNEGKMDSALYYFKRVRKLAYKIDNKTYKSMSTMNIAVVYDLNGKSDSAFVYYLKALDIAQKNGDDKTMCSLYMNLGTFLDERNNQIGAYKYSLKAYKLFKKTENRLKTIQVLSNLAMFQSKLKRYDAAYNYLLELKTLLVKDDFPQYWAFYYKSMASFYSKENNSRFNLDSAIANQKLAAKYFSNAKRPQDLAMMLSGLAELLVEKASKEEAFTIIDSAKKVVANTTLLSEKIVDLQELKLKNYYTTLEGDDLQKLDELYAFFYENEYYSTASEIARYIAINNYKIGDYKKAYEYKKIEFDLNDSILNIENINRMNYLDISEKQAENDKLIIQNNAKNLTIQAQKAAFKNKQIINQLLFALLALGIVFIVLLLYSRRTLHNKNIELKEQKKTIINEYSKAKAQKTELENLLSVVAHDISSPFRNIVGLSNLIISNGGLTKENEDLINYIISASENGISISNDLLQLYRSETETKQLVKISLNELSQQLKNSYAQVALQKRIALEIDHNDQIVIQANLSNLQRILDNLLSNAFKFSPKNSIITLSIFKKNGSNYLSIKDQGPGFTVKDQSKIYQKFTKLSARPTGNESSNGLGLAIVQKLIHDIGATIELNSEVGKGAEFIIKFKD